MNATRKHFPGPAHDHRACVENALKQAVAICRKRGARLTALRRRVLKIIWENHAPLGAYDALDRMNAQGERNAPATVYRALDFLLKHGLVHRIESLNAFVGCSAPADAHAAQFLICRACGNVAETHNEQIGEAIKAGAAQAGFQIETPVVEISGRCPECRHD